MSLKRDHEPDLQQQSTHFLSDTCQNKAAHRYIAEGTDVQLLRSETLVFLCLEQIKCRVGQCQHFWRVDPTSQT